MKRKRSLHFDTDRKLVVYGFLAAAAVIILMAVSAIVVFFINLEGEERVLVPNVVDKPLEDGLLELQERYLFPWIQLNFTSLMEDKGKIIAQDPEPGTLLKAGARITLKVSKGSAIEKLPDFIGKNIDYVRGEIKNFVSIYGPLIVIDEPIIEVFDETPIGTILEQKPLPETDLEIETPVEFIVSKGPQGGIIELIDFKGLNLFDALRECAKDDLPFVFIVRKKRGQELSGIVVSQSPGAGENVKRGTPIQLEITEPEWMTGNEVFGLFEMNLTEYPITTRIRVVKVPLDGERISYFTMQHPGGILMIPYVEVPGTVFIVTEDGEEIRRFTVPKKGI